MFTLFCPNVHKILNKWLLPKLIICVVVRQCAFPGSSRMVHCYKPHIGASHLFTYNFSLLFSVYLFVSLHSSSPVTVTLPRLHGGCSNFPTLGKFHPQNKTWGNWLLVQKSDSTAAINSFEYCFFLFFFNVGAPLLNCMVLMSTLEKESVGRKKKF